MLSRKYKIEVFDLQDNYLGTLKPYQDDYLGKINEVNFKKQDDGTQELTFKIPKYLIDKKTNLKKDNPRWKDFSNNLLVENTRVLKIFIENDDKVYPCLINLIQDKRDQHFSVYREITATGLAYEELGKVGYKLELNSNTLETDYEKDNNTVATINYWLDKVFPNTRENGKIVHWDTPWCYEIRMDWKSYSDKDRQPNKIYEDIFVNSWEIDENNNLVSGGISNLIEKARYIDCKGSNKYNITQTIAETFGVFCTYEYKALQNGQFIKEYTDELGQVWTGKKVVFYNTAIKLDDPLYVSYEKNLSTITREADSSEIFTKLFITPIASDTAYNGYISIANTPANPLLDDFILNFDYLKEQGSLSSYQESFIKKYETNIHNINKNLIQILPQIEDKEVEKNNIKSRQSLLEKEISSAKEELVSYQRLRDNEITNQPVVKDVSNSYSIVFVKDNSIVCARLKLQGIAASSIIGYLDYTYSKEIFRYSNLKIVQDVFQLDPNDKSFYLVLDEYGYPSQIFTSINNTISNGGVLEKAESIIYLSLVYSPANAYEAICNQLNQSINQKSNQLEESNITLEKVENELDELLKQQEDLLLEKQKLNNKLEQILGPALREGYWTPEDYNDPGEKNEASFSLSENTLLKLDKVPFDGEQLSYYYKSIDDLNSDIKTYYQYIDITDIADWKNKNLEELVLHLINPKFTYVASSDFTGKYFILYNAQRYYFNVASTYPSGTVLEIKIENSIPILYANNIKIATGSTIPLDGASNITTLFEGINNYLGDRKIYNNAGFVFAFTQNRAIILLNDTSIDYLKYQNINYSFGNDNSTFPLPAPVQSNQIYDLQYPRIIINKQNVNYDSDNLKITLTEQVLEKFKDYSILTRKGYPYITLKITSNNSSYNILNSTYSIVYQVSRANEMLYLDAKEVAYDNSRPRYSYEISVAILNQQCDLGNLIYINDFSLGVHAATGYVSAYTYNLDKPWEDNIEVKNYKTKFEDLFGTITASSEALKVNKPYYDIAAGGFNPNGTINGSILQQTINNNNISFGYSSTNVEINDENGIVLTNSNPYLNGIYGQVVLQGGGIFLSNAVDANGDRIWSAAITPNGINASLITVGQLDTSLIRIFSGDNLSFQWNGEGIFAYRHNMDGTPDLSTYVKYSEHGLQYIQGDETIVDLGWNGLLISSQDGALELTGKDGLVIYDTKKNESGSNHVVKLGKFEDNTYGLKLYRKDEDSNYIETLITSNNGELWLKDYLIVGTKDQNEGKANIAGISGQTDNLMTPSKSVRFWAGDIYENKTIAPFRVLQDGTLFAEKAIIRGEVHAESGSFTGKIIANSGTIGGWDINETSLSSGNMILSSAKGDNPERININNKFIVKDDGSFTATEAVIKGTITATGGSIGNLTVEDVNNMADDVKDLIGNPEEITVEITSSAGTLTKDDQIFNTTLIANCKKGNIPFEASDYELYQYKWESSPDNKIWNEIATTNSPNYEYSATLNDDIFIRCTLIGG